jgi:hypothetical protein
MPNYAEGGLVTSLRAGANCLDGDNNQAATGTQVRHRRQGSPDAG